MITLKIHGLKKRTYLLMCIYIYVDVLYMFSMIAESRLRKTKFRLFDIRSGIKTRIESKNVCLQYV